MQVLPALALLAVAILSFGLISRRVEKSIITPALFFVTFGLIVGQLAADLVPPATVTTFTRVLATVTLVMVLFIDASRIDARQLLHDHLPLRLLGIGLPLMILFGAIAAKLVIPSLMIGEVLLLAVLLTPTDAALGLPTVTDPHVPPHIRRSLATEAGLNDGLALTALLIAIAFAQPDESPQRIISWLLFMAVQISVGAAVAAAIGWGIGKLIDYCSGRLWMLKTYERLAAIGLALLSYTVAELLHGNGFIAAFCCGLFLNVHSQQVRGRLVDFGEAEAEQLSLITFLVFGAIMIPAAYPYWDWQALIYALLSLTLLRIGSVALCMIGSKEKWDTVLFVGWFGPRGIASILFSLLILEEHMQARYAYILAIVVLTVALSVLLHGVTAHPWARLYAKRLGG